MIGTGATQDYLAEVERLGLFLEKGEGRGKAKALNSAAQPGVAKSVLVNLGPIDPRIRGLVSGLAGIGLICFAVLNIRKASMYPDLLAAAKKKG
nr:uncharacterized protein LOC111412751 [Ipomoea batatas]